VLAAQRKALILEEVSLSGARRSSELTSSLEVSEVTIRRDVEALADQGLLDTFHGGVTANSLPSTVEPPFAFNSLKEQTSKDAVAKLAARMVHPGQAIALMVEARSTLLQKDSEKCPHSPLSPTQFQCRNYSLSNQERTRQSC